MSEAPINLLTKRWMTKKWGSIVREDFCEAHLFVINFSVNNISVITPVR